MSGNFTFQEEIYGQESQLPLIYMMTNGESIFILYNPFMTFLDGYDPFTGKQKNPMVSEQLINSYRIALYGDLTDTRNSDDEEEHITP